MEAVGSRLDSLLHELFDEEADDAEIFACVDANATGQLALHTETPALRFPEPRPSPACENDIDKGISNDLDHPLLKALKDSMKRHDYHRPGNLCSWGAKGTQPASAAHVLRPLPGLSIIRQALSETQQLAAASDILSSGCMAQKHAHISNGVGSGAADGSPGGSCHPKGLPNQAMFFGDLPPWALRLMKLLPLGDLLPPDLAAREPSFDQAIVNLYRPGEGIASHVDLARFEDGIVSVSIGGPVVMHFTRCGQRVSIGGHISTGNDGLSASDEGCSTGGGATWISTCSGDGGARCWSAGDEGCNQRPGGMAPEQEALGGAQSPTGQAASHPPWKRQRCVLEAEGCLEGLPQLPASPFPSPQQRQQRQTHPEGPKEPPKPQQPDRCDAEIRGCDTACTIEGIQQQQQEQTDGGCATWNGGVRWCGTDHLCVLLQGGDLLGMSGEARYGWEHGIRMVASELWGERECDGCTRGTAAVVKATAVAATRCHDTDSPLSESDPGSGKDTETEIDPGKQQAREARLKSKGEPSAMSAVACNAEEGTGVEEGGPTAGLDTRFGGLVTEVVREQNAGKSEESGLIPIVRGVRLSITFRRLCPDIVLCEM